MVKLGRVIEAFGFINPSLKRFLWPLRNCKQVHSIVSAGMMMFALFITVSCTVTEKPVDALPKNLTTLFVMMQSGANASDIQSILTTIKNVPHTDPNWPIATYLAGEAYLKLDDVKQARKFFRDLAQWTASDQSKGTYKDGWGVSGLAVMGLWRWLQLLDMEAGAPEPKEVDQVLKATSALQRTRLFAGMVHGDLLPSLPLIEEDVARLLSHIAWKANRPETLALFLDFVSINSTGEFDATDNKIKEKMLNDGLASPERWELFRYRRELNLVKTDDRKHHAVEKLRKLWENEKAPPEVRAEAGYLWADFYRKNKDKKQTVVGVLTSAYNLVNGRGSIAEMALYRRGTVHNSVEPREPDAFFADMYLLLERFPNSRLADDATYLLASEYLFGQAQDYKKAFHYFEKLRAFEGANDWLDSGYVLAAIGLVERGTDADLRAADSLLADYIEQFPDRPFRLRSMFWRGRIAEINNNAKKAQRFFQQIVNEAPYNYYGFRASMHLEYGKGAISMTVPPANAKTWSKLYEVYSKSVPDEELKGITPYHERLRGAVHTGLYSQLLQIVNGLGKQFHNRIDNIPLQELDKYNLIPAVALQLALRQDALAARDADYTSDNQLNLAGFLGRKVSDWPISIAMTLLREGAPHECITKLQNDPRYLATVYPSINAMSALKKPLADAAWRIDGSDTISQSLMYAIIRSESRFFPGAISPAGALGLFQIMPKTFKERPDCWIVAKKDKKPTAIPYLFDPYRNTQFWSCWVRKEFKPQSRDSIVTMLVQHHAGQGNLKKWMAAWKGRATEQDLELQVDTYRFPETQVLVRQILTDVVVVDASGFFNSGDDTIRRKQHAYTNGKTD